ncbi:MAG: hypothetical protein IVW52_07060 [Acidimicrobiales bacterium]|nr:hypothetical protein [Acidimicrobiales bacterium]
MLRMKACRYGAALAILTLVVVAPSGEAWAVVGGGGSCTDTGNTVSCGSGVSGNTGTGSGSGGDGAPTGGGGATTVSVPTCPNYVPYSTEFPGQDGGPPPAGATQPGAWYVNTCATGSVTGQSTGVVWLATGQAAPTVPPPDPAVAGAQAASELQLPTPTLTLSPSTTGYVNLAEWLWITSSMWHPLSTTAQACNAGGCVAATAIATPSYVTWDTGDGSTVTCNGPGTPFDPALPATDQSTTCSHTYTTTSAGQPSADGNPNDAAFRITATITWTVAWAGPNGSAGALPSLTTRGASSLEVAQIESVNN